MNQPIKSVIVLVCLLLSALGIMVTLPSPAGISVKEDCYVSQGDPNRNFNVGVYSYLLVGVFDSKQLWSYLKFDFPEIPSEAVINDVTLELHVGILNVEAWADYPYSTLYLTVREASADWSENSMTWNTKASVATELVRLSINKPETTYFAKISASVVQDYVRNQKQFAIVIMPENFVKAYSGALFYCVFGSKEKGDGTRLIVAYSIPQYALTVTVKDQCGNSLPAIVHVDSDVATCDKNGKATLNVASGLRTVKAEIKVGIQTFSKTETITITTAITKDITIIRRFFWTFSINYTDGSFATGTLTLASSQETVTASVTNGLGEAYLLNGKYSVSFSASPAISLTTLDVTNDGEMLATLNKALTTIESTSQSTIPTDAANSPVSSGALPYYLLPSVYIYGLLGVLVFGFIIAAVVALRRKQK